jgi:hypothetical protein
MGFDNQAGIILQALQLGPVGSQLNLQESVRKL